MSNEQQIKEAEAALHQLATGRSVVSITRNGQKVDFQPAQYAQLEAYVTKLKGGRRAISVNL